MAASVTQLTSDPVRGSIACVGIGMTLGSHLTPLARSHILQADVVFTAVSDNLVELWLQRMHPDVRSLQPYYGEGKPRKTTYREWVDVMMTEVRAGKRVCAAFYGHPGVFAWSPRKAIEVARAEGYVAHMEPGISAEDCLYADLGIDPGRCGLQHFEASQLLLYQRNIDTAGHVVLWQVGVLGNRSIAGPATRLAYRELLLELLASDYPLDHEVILYRCATLPIERASIRRVALRDLTDTDISAEETVVLPPCAPLLRRARFADQIAALENVRPTSHHAAQRQSHEQAGNLSWSQPASKRPAT